MLRKFNPNQFRDDFPVLARSAASGKPLAYLDNAASSQRPSAVIDAMSDCYRRYYSNVHRGIHTLSEETTAKYEQARQSVASFINAADCKEVIFTGGCTAAINAVASSWGSVNVGQGDVILLPISEHHANIVPWHQLAVRTGCRVEFIPLGDEFLIDDEVVREHLERLKPKMFAFAAASNALGTEYPVRRWVQMAREVDAAVLIDAAQAGPHRPVDVQAWDADFIALSGHKMCGPTGIGVLWGKEALLDAIPPFMGGGGMIASVTTEGFSALGLPEKFEAGTPPIVEAIGLAAAVDYLTAVGLENIHAHEQALCERADSALREIEGVTIFGPPPERKAGIVSFTMRGIHAHDISQWLDTKGIAVRAGHHCTMPLHKSLGINASVRASFYFYNTIDEADRLVEAIGLVRQKFAPSGRRRKRS